ncbi:MAG TPA: ubiquinol-cytochrome C chaperone family protein [Alphaproteobacteria bacterium]|jgi:cytochrome b pre-mRNA-processing protein 3
MGLLDFLSAKDRSARGHAAAALYAAAVAQARQPAFYAALGAPDTLEGRFELIVLHVHLLCRRLGGIRQGGAALAQALFDAMFRDMDRNLRELGVGDPSLPRRIRAMIEAYYGRTKAYDAAIVQGREALAGAIARNVCNAETPGAEALALADYVLRVARAAEAQPDEALLAGRVDFPPIDALRAANTA